MALDLTTALNSYGFFGQIANAIPELRDILTQAQNAEWAPEQFTRALNDSPWWKTNADAVRKLAILNATDPATYNQNLANARNKIQLLAWQMGKDGGDWQSLAYQSLANNWDDQQIRTVLGTLRTPSLDGGYGGEAGQIQGHLRKLNADYGLNYTDQYIDTILGYIQTGHQTLDGFDNLAKARAKAQYPHLAAQIDAGMTVRDIADPYIASYAQTLELPETSVTLKDPAIQKALQTKNADGTFSTKPMYEFVRQLKDDPRWDNTKNAEDEAYRFTNRLGKDMGFLS